MAALHRPSRSLQRRFLIAVVLGATLFALIAAAVAYKIGYYRAIEAGRNTIEDLVSAVEKTAAVGAFTADKLLLQEVIHGLAHNQFVAQVDIQGQDGKLLIRSADRAAEPGAVVVTRRLNSPFPHGDAVGVLRVQADMAQMNASARQQAWTLALLMVAQSAVIALILTAVGSRLISRPIVRLASKLASMQPGTSQRMKTPRRHRDDEIGMLIAGANALLQSNESALDRERRLRAEVEALEAQYRQIFDSTSAGIFVLGPDGKLINSNPTALKVIGWSLNDIQRLKGVDFIQQVFARPDRVLEMIDNAERRRETVSSDMELLSSCESARWVHCLISVQNSASTQRLIEGVMYDITERKRAEVAVQHLAEHDSLTGLKNRAASEALIDRFVADAQAAAAALTVMYVDLDGFKQVNDVLGHRAGDQVLMECATRMKAAVRRSSDLVGRLGGDEFVVALYNCGPDDDTLSQIVSALLASLCQPIMLDEGLSAQLGASIGLASYPRHGVTRRQLLHAADEAMYEVKRTGKNTFAMAVGASSLS